LIVLIVSEVIGITANRDVQSRMRKHACDFGQFFPGSGSNGYLPVSNKTSGMLTISPRALSRSAE
jgi:hypothetical protein